jgi:hypothetical protein
MRRDARCSGGAFRHRGNHEGGHPLAGKNSHKAPAVSRLDHGERSAHAVQPLEKASDWTRAASRGEKAPAGLDWVASENCDAHLENENKDQAQHCSDANSSEHSYSHGSNSGAEGGKDP